MRIEIRNDSVILDGYVNAVGRDSRPLITAAGKCVEQIEPGSFRRALEKANNVNLLLNHDAARRLGSTGDGNLTLSEDNIGLRAIGKVTDAEVVKKARDGKLRGWSFGMYVGRERVEERADTIPRRHVEELDLIEVSVIDERMTPAYAGTSIEQRGGADLIAETRTEEFTAVITDSSANETKQETPAPDYSEYLNKIKNLKENNNV